jgi:cytochrome c oxidase subunit 2
VSAHPPAWRLPPLVIAGILVLSWVTACGGGSSSSAPTATSMPTAAETATAASAAAQGQELYASKGCKACHSIDGSTGAGPTFKGLAGAQVKLASGSPVTADDSYLMSSIMDPDKHIVAGFMPGVMSSSVPKGSISASDATALVAYIKTLR